MEIVRACARRPDASVLVTKTHLLRYDVDGARADDTARFRCRSLVSHSRPKAPMSENDVFTTFWPLAEYARLNYKQLVRPRV